MNTTTNDTPSYKAEVESIISSMADLRNTDRMNRAIEILQSYMALLQRVRRYDETHNTIESASDLSYCIIRGDMLAERLYNVPSKGTF